MDSVTRLILLVIVAIASSYFVGAALGAIYGLVSIAAGKLFRFWNSHETAPKKRGGREVDAGDIVDLLGELTQRARIPSPRLYLVDSPFANASAASRDYRHSSICVTTGLLHALNREELAAVLSHEIAHVLQRSSLTQTIAAVLMAGFSLFPFVCPFIGLGLVFSIILLFVAPLVGLLVQLAISRAEEYAADERGARLSGRPEALAAALRLGSTDDAETDDVANSQVAKSLLAIGKRLVGPQSDNPFSSYPLTTNRIAALERLARDLRPDPVTPLPAP